MSEAYPIEHKVTDDGIRTTIESRLQIRATQYVDSALLKANPHFQDELQARNEREIKQFIERTALNDPECRVSQMIRVAIDCLDRMSEPMASASDAAHHADILRSQLDDNAR